MNATPDMLAPAHAAADGLIALSCLVIAACLFLFAAENRRARLSPVFVVFAVLFACGGAMHVCEAAGWSGVGAAFKALTALSCAAGAALAVRCLPLARVKFARLAVLERRAGERIARLRADPRYDTPEDREAQAMLSEMKDLARLAREAVTPEEV